MSLKGRLYLNEFHSQLAELKMQSIFYQTITVLEAYGHSEEASRKLAVSLVEHVKSTYRPSDENPVWIQILKPIDCSIINGVSDEFREHFLINRVSKYGRDRCSALKNAWWVLVHDCFAETVHSILTKSGHPEFP